MYLAKSCLPKVLVISLTSKAPSLKFKLYMGVGVGGGATGGGVGAAGSLNPQLSQKMESGGFLFPHWGHSMLIVNTIYFLITVASPFNLFLSSSVSFPFSIVCSVTRITVSPIVVRNLSCLTIVAALGSFITVSMRL